MENEFQKEIDKDLHKEEKEYYYIYFNEIHDISKEIKIEISNEYREYNTLEIFDGKNPFQSIYNSNTVLKIYRFKLYPDLVEQNKDIIIHVEQLDKNVEFNLNLENIDIHKDYFEYDLYQKAKEIDFIKTSYEQQFEIYINFIQNVLNKNENSKENEELILSTLRLFSEKNSKYSFYFYMLIFKKCLNTPILQKFILLFDPEKIKEISDFPEKEIIEIKTLVDIYLNKKKEIIIDDETQKQKIIKEFYFIIFCFYNFYDRNSVKIMLDNDEIFELVYHKLFFYRNFFQGLILNNEQANKLIIKTDNLNQILYVFDYLGNNLLNLIIIINKR